MKRIEVKLSLEVVAPLLDVIREMAGGLNSALAAPLVMVDLDEELRHAWIHDLLLAQNQDLRTLLALFGGDFFQEGVIALDEENAEQVIRACAAVRLRLRAEHLRDLNDEAMESGAIDLQSLPEPRRKAFMCYLFLATLQELIIQHLNPATPEM